MTISGTVPNAVAAQRTDGLRPRDRLELTFSDLLQNGQAVGRHNGIVVFCFGPLPDERARVEITAVKPKYAVAKLLDLVEVSADRAEPFCPVFGDCGGCQVQHVRYAAQLQWKRGIVAAALERIGGFPDVNVGETIGMRHPRAYRNKMALVAHQAPTGITLGFYRQRSHDVVAIQSCPIVAPQLDACITTLNAARSDPAISPALRDARHVVARTSRASHRSVVTFTTQRESAAVRAAGPALMAKLPALAGVTNSYGRSGENAILGPHQRVVAGTADIEEMVSGVRYRVPAGSFFQVNVEMLECILAYVRPMLSSGTSIVDLYCGAGTFALFFAAHGCSVVGVEEHAGAVAEANANAKRNAVAHLVEFVTGRVEAAVGAQRVREALEQASVVFLDPPRKGSDRATLSAIADARVAAVWYLSCDPATLARDLRFLASKGYRLGCVQPFDMFPQTGHVETLAVLHHFTHVPE